MSSGFRACVAYRNLADDGAITVSNPAPNMGGNFLRDRHVGRKWRSLGTSAYVILDLLKVTPVDTIALLGMNLTANAFMRVRVSSADSSGADGDVYDTGNFQGFDPRYPALISLVPDVVGGRYVRIDLADESLAYIQAGRLVVAARDQFSINYVYGWAAGRVDRSRKTESRGGQLFIDRDNSYRTLELQFDLLEKDERYGFIEEMERINGESEDILFFTNPESEHLSRDTVWGLVEEQQPIVEPYFERFSKSYRIRERL